MALQTVDRRRGYSPQAPLPRVIERQRRPHRQESAEPPMGIGLDFHAERRYVDALFAREVDHVARVVPAHHGIVISHAPALLGWWRMLLVAAVAAVILAFALLPRPTVYSGWSQNGVVGQALPVEQVPYSGPAVITGEAAPTR